MQKLENALDFLTRIQTQFAATPSLFDPVEESIGCTPATFITKVNAYATTLSKEYAEYQAAFAAENVADGTLAAAEYALRIAYKQLTYVLKAEYYPDAARVYPFLFENLHQGATHGCLKQLLANLETNHIVPVLATDFVTKAANALSVYEAAVVKAGATDGNKVTEGEQAKTALAAAYTFVKILKSVLRAAYRGHADLLALLFPVKKSAAADEAGAAAAGTTAEAVAPATGGSVPTA